MVMTGGPTLTWTDIRTASSFLYLPCAAPTTPDAAVRDSSPAPAVLFRLVKLNRSVDQGQVSEGLREVAQHRAGLGSRLLAEETEVVGAVPKFLEQVLGVGRLIYPRASPRDHRRRQAALARLR